MEGRASSGMEYSHLAVPILLTVVSPLHFRCLRHVSRSRIRASRNAQIPRPCPGFFIGPETKENLLLVVMNEALLSIYCGLSVSNTSFHSTYSVLGAIHKNQYLLHPCFREEEVSTQR